MLGSTAFLFLIGIAVKSTAILALAWFVAVFLRRKSAAMRHVLWTVALSALLALPLLSLSLPALRLRAPLLSSDFVLRVNFSATGVAAAFTSERAGGTMALNAAHWLYDWRAWLVLLWLVGASMSFAQMLVGGIELRRLRQRAKWVILPELRRLAADLDISKKIDVFEIPQGGMPFTYGFFQPALFIPAEILASGIELRQTVLLHELAHVRRGDCSMQFMARIAMCFYWWHPLVWLTFREFLKERERAADDLVLRAGACASDYATHMLEIARSLQPPALVRSAAIAMARRSQLEGRLLAILNENRDRRTLGRVFSIMAFAFALGIVAPLAALQAQNSSAPSNSVTIGSAAATNYIHSGIAELAGKNYAKATDDFEQAQKADPQQAGDSEMWIAVAQERQNNLEAADAEYQAAIAAQPPDSAAAATTLDLYAQLLRQNGKEEEANKIQSQSSAIRQKLEAHEALLIAPSSPDVYRIGGDVKPPVLLSKVEPQYSDEARVAKYQGTALLYVEVTAEGSVRNVHVLRGLGLGLDEKAIEAVKQWKFNPAAKNGQAVAVSAHIEVNFRLL